MASDIGRLEAKLLSMTIIFLLMFVCALLPIWVANWVKNKGATGVFVISALRCFGGGVFFGAYLLHSAPDVREVLENAWLIPAGIDFPMTEFITGLGFFFIMFLEQFIGWIMMRSAARQVEPALPPSSSRPESKLSKIKEDDKEIAYTNNGVDLTAFNQGDTEAEKSHTNGNGAVVTEVFDDAENGSAHAEKQAETYRYRSVSNTSSTTKHHHQTASFGHGHSHLGALNLQPKVHDDDVMSVVSTHKTAIMAVSSQSIVRTIVFVVAMSFDCIFEGMALGLKTTTLAVFNLFIAIISHEFVMAFCLGLELTQYYKPKFVALGAFLYALTIPIGVSIGILIYETQENPSVGIEITNGVLQCMSAGTFIYVALLGILSYEMADKTSFSRMLAVIIGFMFMASMALIEPADDVVTEETTAAIWTTAAMVL